MFIAPIAGTARNVFSTGSASHPIVVTIAIQLCWECDFSTVIASPLALSCKAATTTQRDATRPTVPPYPLKNSKGCLDLRIARR